MVNKTIGIWVTNHSNTRSVYLYDLHLNIPPKACINLLELKGLIQDKVEESWQNGSLKQRQELGELMVTLEKPEIKQSKALEISAWKKGFIPKIRSVVKTEELRFEELEDGSKMPVGLGGLIKDDEDEGLF